MSFVLCLRVPDVGRRLQYHEDDERKYVRDGERGARAGRAQCDRIPASRSSRDEHVALVADEASRDVAASLEQALAEAGAPGDGVLIEPVAGRPITAAPPEYSTRSSTPTPAFSACSRRKGELAARMAIVALVERRRIRYAHMVGVTPQIMREGMRADYRQVDRLSQQLCERMHACERADRRNAGRHRLHRDLRSRASRG